MTAKPFGLLTVGNVVNTALSFYGANFKRYLRLSFFAHLWLLLAIIVLAGAILVGITLATNSLNILGIGICLFSLVVFIPSLARYFLEAALISRLCFGELIEQPESNREAGLQVTKKFWSFLIVFVNINIGLFLVYFGFSVVVVGIAIAMTVLPQDTGTLANLILGLIFLAFLIVPTLISFRLVARWIVAELPLAVEADFNASTSIKRSWELTKGSVNRIQGIITVGFLVTIPLEIAALTITEFVQATFDSRNVNLAIAFGIPTLFTLGVNVLVLPFWQAIKAVIYYDLRNRREGRDIQLRSMEIAR